MNSLDLLMLFGSVVLSGSAYYLFREPSQRMLKLLLSFSGAYLFAISVLHLMPEVYANKGAGIGAWIMAGFFLQIILEYFSEGIEHGHVHIHHHHDHSAFPLSMMISLSLHSFLEGMPLAANGGHSHDLHEHSLLYGIILHHIPVAFALVSMLQASGITKKMSVFYLIIFAAMAPLGAVAGELLQHNEISFITAFADQIMAIVIGIFLHISTTILFESGSDHRFNLYKIVAILTGGLLGLGSFYF